MSYLIGSLVLQARRSPTTMPWFFHPDHQLYPDSLTSGQHLPNRLLGKYWSGSKQGLSFDIEIPQRDKHFEVNATLDLGFSVLAQEKLTSAFSTLDSMYLGEPQHYKLMQTQKALEESLGFHQACLVTTGKHSSVNFITSQTPLYMIGIYNNDETQLLWSSIQNLDEFVRQSFGQQYLLYRFPIIESGALFISTQAACSKWWRWAPKGPLLAFNALEVMLFKS